MTGQAGRPARATTSAQNSETPGHALRVWLSVLVLAGCGETSFSKVQRDIFAAPLELDFGEVYVGSRGALPLQLTNAGRMSQAAHLELALPFDAPRELALGGGASSEVQVAFLPTEPGAVTGALIIGAQTLVLRGVGLEVPECRSPGACFSTSFDVIEQRCLVAPLPEGSGCTSRCVPSGVCSQGACAGDFASCDDANACTDDACSEQDGCMHTPKRCPDSPTNPCRVGACDPQRGCVFIDAMDGARCGPKNCQTRTVDVCIAAQCVARPLASPECLDQFAYLKASNAEAGDSFGNRVALSADGNTLVVSSSVEGGENNTAPLSGAVYVFRRSGQTWLEEARLKASTFGAGDSFGYAVAISADGQTIAVGAHQEDGQNETLPGSGAVFLFVRSAGAWVEETTLRASNAEERDAFGASVALSADGARLVVGATGEDSAGSDAGAVYLFERTAGAWTQRAILWASNGQGGDLFGFSVAISANGSTLAVGALGEDSNATGVQGDETNDGAAQSGAVYLFRIAAFDVVQTTYVKASNTGAADVFGVSVSLSNDGAVLAVGAYGEDGNAVGVNGSQGGNWASQSGAVYLFRKQAGVWAQEAYVKASNTRLGDSFGYSVALSGDGLALAVGAWSEDSGSTGVDGHQFNASAPEGGAVYVLRRSNGAWSHDGYVKASNTGTGDMFGSSVALSADADTLASSATGEASSARGINGNQADDGAPASGAVYVFSLQ
jgi:hypothetical protein